MGGAAEEQQLYLRQPLPAASGLSVVEGCQAGIFGALLWAEVPQEICSCAGKAFLIVSARFDPPSLPYLFPLLYST